MTPPRLRYWEGPPSMAGSLFPDDEPWPLWAHPFVSMEHRRTHRPTPEALDALRSFYGLGR